MKTDQQQQARNLFFQADMQPKDIAQVLNISERTCFRWMKEQQWKQLKKAAQCMPANIVDNFQWQIVRIQQKILSRPPEEQFATLEEAATLSKLVLCITRMKAQVTQANSIQILQNYIGMVNSLDPELAKRNIPIANEYLNGKAVNGFNPYDIEYETEDLRDDEEIEQETEASLTTVSSHDEEQQEMTPNDTECQLLTFSEKIDKSLEAAPAKPSNAVQPDNKQVSTDKKNADNILPNGLVWLGGGWVFDPQLGRKREIKMGEYNYLVQKGFDTRQLGHW